MTDPKPNSTAEFVTGLLVVFFGTFFLAPVLTNRLHRWWPPECPPDAFLAVAPLAWNGIAQFTLIFAAPKTHHRPVHLEAFDDRCTAPDRDRVTDLAAFRLAPEVDTAAPDDTGDPP